MMPPTFNPNAYSSRPAPFNGTYGETHVPTPQGAAHANPANPQYAYSPQHNGFEMQPGRAQGAQHLPHLQQPQGFAQGVAAHTARQQFTAAPRYTPYPASSPRDFAVALDALRHDINKTMGPVQRNGARVLNVVGTLASIGAAATAGVMGMTALASAATGIGMPVAAVAALTGLAVGLGGMAVTVLVTAGVRSMLRQNVAHDEGLRSRLDATRALRDHLAAKPQLSKEEKRLLRLTKQILGKVDGFGASVKAQIKTSTKTTTFAAAGVFLAAITAAAAESTPFFWGPHSNLSIGGFDGPSSSSGNFSATPGLGTAEELQSNLILQALRATAV